jgi:predicted nucleic acid-binding protein
MPDVYLDSSALVKRYVLEPGTSAVDLIFDRASVGALVIATSVWNVGEAFGIFDYRRRRRLMTEHEFHVAIQSLTSELLGLMRRGMLQVYPVRTSLLIEAWSLILAQHVYEADALQIATCNQSKTRMLITSDEALRRASKEVGLQAFDPQKHQHEIEDILGTNEEK